MIVRDGELRLPSIRSINVAASNSPLFRMGV